MLRILLFPFTLLYGLAIRFRHFLFDMGLLPSKSFEIPVIGVGNLALGGTGKTPHTEYLARLLKNKYHVAILSRGYRRKSKGFILATASSTYRDIGDEPMQYLRKFGKEVLVAVDKNRRRGVKKLLQQNPPPETILLDDALQHRFIKPGLNLLLTDYHRLFVDDYLLPAGRLRDVKASADRADIIIITKTENVLSPIVRKIILEKLKPKAHQKVFFSYLKYSHPVAFPSMEVTEFKEKYSAIILFSGIANPYPLKDYLRYRCRDLITIDFSDHHIYTEGDIRLIKQKWVNHFSRNKLLVTTEKDAMRLINSPYLRLLKNIPMVFLPIEVKFHGNDEKEFNQEILNYVRENQRNGTIYSVKNHH